jgi:hypothetical protein
MSARPAHVGIVSPTGATSLQWNNMWKHDASINPQSSKPLEAHGSHQQQCLPMHMQRVGRDRCQKALQHTKLHTIICNIIASAQQLHSLCLQMTTAIPWQTACLSSNSLHGSILECMSDIGNKPHVGGCCRAAASDRNYLGRQAFCIFRSIVVILICCGTPLGFGSSSIPLVVDSVHTTLL